MPTLQEILSANAQAFQGLTDPTAIVNKIAEVAKAGGHNILVDNAKEPSYIPKSRLDEVIGQKNELKTQVSELTGQLEGLKKNAGDSDKLVKQIEELQGKATAAEKAMLDKTKLSEIKIAALQGKVRKDALDDITKFFDLGKVEIKADGSISGIQEQLDALAKSKAFLFDSVPGGTGNPGNPGGNGGGGTPPGGAGESIGAKLAEMAKASNAAASTVNYFG